MGNDLLSQVGSGLALLSGHNPPYSDIGGQSSMTTHTNPYPFDQSLFLQMLRNSYQQPIDKRQRAKEYAAEVRLRKPHMQVARITERDKAG